MTLQKTVGWGLLFAVLCFTNITGADAQTLPNSVRAIPVARTVKSFDAPDAGHLPQAALTEIGGAYSTAAYYRAVLRQVGRQEPFVRLYRDTQQQRDALIEICRQMQVSVPENRYRSVRSPKTYRECALTGAELAVQTIALCDRLLRESKDNAKMERALTAMRERTLKIHLPLLLKAGRDPIVSPRR